MAAVKAESLKNPEQNLEILDRETGANDAAAQLLALRRRIRAGQNAVGVDPRPKDAPACRECFQRGWIAAMRSLED